jgi:UPF0755 protein
MKRLIVVIIILLIGIATTGFWWTSGLSPSDSKDNKPVIFAVKQGEGVREIANRLKSQDLIRNPIVFFLFTRINGLDKQIQAGDFRINASMTTPEIANSLTHGTLDIWVTLPEGLRAEEIAEILKDKLPEYEDSWRQELKSNEGYLFPDTYLIPRDATIETVINLFRNNFDNKFNSIKNEKTTGLSDADTVIVASIIEREAAFDTDRPLVGSVIMNRLNLGMALQVDPAIQYAVGYDAPTKKWWKKELTFDDLKINSPYNLHLNAGLPPTAISNPGLSSLKAALNPLVSDYLYFYSDSKGQLHLAKDLNGHNANIQKYSGN